tara:strand:- start:6410 stop:6835 length:426 start_codon:yes stop_codon:yes gene_type:complete
LIYENKNNNRRTKQKEPEKAISWVLLFNPLYLSWYYRFNYCDEMANRIEIPLWKKKSKCWDNFIRVYPVALSKGPRPEVRLEIEIRGQFKEGTIIYKQTKKGKHEIAKKIDEVYEWLYENYSHKFRQRYGAHYKRKHFSFD